MEIVPAFGADIMYALMWLCVIASVCSAGTWLWKLLINLDIRQDYAPALWAIGLALGASLLWCGQGALGSEAPLYERGEATFITFWILLSGVCLVGPFALLFHRSPDSPRGPGA
ncbi:hypothetical protein [Pseudomonas oryzihabitans]|uniref:Uncharacterized protein n=1 Tax=Pseudomonas oryzihabitans TaxID=47885 RepID=A0A1G5PDL5_9PSED|nr:hypothetical protein [Pseudomonas psychrotolerans]NMY91746.1 hypothetical protein [Pseudomonas psychrotolerans]NMY92041.1 hypothetical protein [Pseudomonas psychrotolerans]SCZ47607.1 hypothetical protein SAMN05216279_1154 [Pseudomonas psychrotolerans]